MNYNLWLMNLILWLRGSKKVATIFKLEKIISRIKLQIIAARKVYGIGPSLALMIFLSPFIIVFFVCIFLLLSSTRPVLISIIIQDQLVMGSLTAAFLIAGGILGLRMVFKIKKNKKGLLRFWFYLALSAGLLFLGMEKIRWGQMFFISSVSSGMNNINQQTETVVHTFQFWRDHLEIFPLTFGLAGLLGIWLSNRQRLVKINTPNILLSWFAIIVFVSAIDLTHDFYKPIPGFDDFVDNLEDVIEMMVGISGFLFNWLNLKRFSLLNKQ